MSVVLMVFAAVLGATFVSLVGLNLQQTARSSHKGDAIQAVRAGIEYSRQKFSTQGLSWRPKNEMPPPKPDDTSHRFYYDEFDRAQGWNTTGVLENDAQYHSDGFVRYPDPRSPVGSSTLPFMVKVEKVAQGDNDNLREERTHDLRVTIIGRSSQNQAIYERRVFYQQGLARQPLTSNLRCVTNWDFAAQTVPSAQIASVSGNTLILTKVRGAFAAGGNFCVTVGDPLTGRGVRSAVVESYNASTRSLKLTAPVAPAPQAGERVEMAAVLGTSPFLDFDNDGTLEATESVSFDFASSAGSSGGVRVNGGLLWAGSVRALQLRSAQTSSVEAPSATLRASGLMHFVSTPSAPSSVAVAGEYMSSSGRQNTNSLALVSSGDAYFPGLWGRMSASEKAQLVDDGWNRIASVPSSARQIAPLVPPDITAGGSQNRYRRLSQYSKPGRAGEPGNAALYGYGEGIYIANTRDRERVSASGALREMTQSELRMLWFSNASSPAYTRLGTPISRTAANRSLEEQHLRGWIGPDEFRPRGALVEINSDNTLTITLDSRDDSAAYNLGAAPHKAWRDGRGALLGHATAGGVYTQTFAWPQNGVLFAEGNLRVRGQATNPPHSLTVVSMNNIYIEGSLSAGTRKIAVLARRNVVVNPTGVLARTDDQTLLQAPVTTLPSTSLRVYNAAAFRPGDWIYLDNNSSNAQNVCVQSVDAANNILRLLPSTPVTSTQPALRPVRSKTDPLNNGEPFTRYNRLDRFSQALQRRVVLPPETGSEIRLALRHSAERRAAVRLPYLDGIGAPNTALLGFKVAPSANTSLLHTGNKVLIVSDGPGVQDAWGVARPLDAVTKTTSYHMNWLAGPTLPTFPQNGVLRYRTAPGWRYADPSTVLILNHYGENLTTGGALRLPPFYFLAAVGNRPDALSTGGWPWRPDIKARGFYDIPMATSVVTTLNGTFSNEGTGGIRSDAWSVATNSYERVGQFGFNPLHGATYPEANSTNQTEDVATVDQSFYVNYAGSPLAPQSNLLDSRVFSGAQSGSNTFSLRFNSALVDGPYQVADYFDATSYSSQGGRVPYYNLSRIKLENVGMNEAHEFESLAPATTFDIRAFVYAQEGSWLVLPNDWYDGTVRNNTDLNRDSILTRAEQIGAYRYRRYNYKINFVGAITENQSPVVYSSGNVPGVVADWTDKWATVSLDARNFASPTGTFLDNASAASANFGTILYQFDDEVARGLFDEDAGLHIPIAPAESMS